MRVSRDGGEKGRQRGKLFARVRDREFLFVFNQLIRVQSSRNCQRRSWYRIGRSCIAYGAMFLL